MSGDGLADGPKQATQQKGNCGVQDCILYIYITGPKRKRDVLHKDPRVIYYFVLRPNNAQLFHKLSHSYMFRHYCVILR